MRSEKSRHSKHNKTTPKQHLQSDLTHLTLITPQRVTCSPTPTLSLTRLRTAGDHQCMTWVYVVHMQINLGGNGGRIAEDVQPFFVQVSIPATRLEEL